MKKKSGQKAADRFHQRLDRLTQYLYEVEAAGLSKQSITWCHELALIKAYSHFERLMLDCIVVAINNNSGTISDTTGIRFPKHLEDSVCEYLVVGSGYFDFKGRSGLIREVRKFVPESHWLLRVVKQFDPASLDRFIALRNFAAHGSAQSKQKALEACGCKRMLSAGSWLKVSKRGYRMIEDLEKFGATIKSEAPY